jgi:N-acetylglucosamine kinase-like BadF-type ATPase
MFKAIGAVLNLVENTAVKTDAIASDLLDTAALKSAELKLDAVVSFAKKVEDFGGIDTIKKNLEIMDILNMMHDPEIKEKTRAKLLKAI